MVKHRKLNRRHVRTCIPAILLYDPTLSLIEAFVLAEVYELDGEEGCYAMNKHFATLLRTTAGQAGRVISSLVKKGRLNREIIPSKKGTRRFLEVVFEIKGHTVKTPGGHTAEMPGGHTAEMPGGHTAEMPGGGRQKCSEGVGKNAGCYIDEFSLEIAGEERKAPPPLEFWDVIKKLPNTKAGNALRKAIESKPLLTEGFCFWLITEAIARFDRKIELSEADLDDWAEQFEIYGEDLFTEAVKSIKLKDETKGCLPSIGKIVAQAKIFKAKRKKPPPKPEQKGKPMEALKNKASSELRRMLKVKKNQDNTFLLSMIRKVLRERETAKMVAQSKAAAEKKRKANG